MYVSDTSSYCIIVDRSWQAVRGFWKNIFEKIGKKVNKFPQEGDNENNTKDKINTYPPLFNALFVSYVQQTGYFFYN